MRLLSARKCLSVGGPGWLHTSGHQTASQPHCNSVRAWPAPCCFLHAPESHVVCGDHGRVSRGRIAAERSDRELIHMEVLERFARRATLSPSILAKFHVSDVFRFPTQEFRSLILNILSKLAPLDRGLWNRQKVPLCSLMMRYLEEELQGAAGPALDPAVTPARAAEAPGSEGPGRSAGACAGPFSLALEQLLDQGLQRDRQTVDKLMLDDRIPEAQKESIRVKLESRRHTVAQQVITWCRETASHPDIALMTPFLKQVLELEPEPPFQQTGRDGSKTEDLVFELMERELPLGWSLYGGAQLLKIDDEAFPNQKFLKGEADLLLTDPDGMVQALLEVKTCSGNVFLALYEDVVRYLALMDRVRGHLVTFALADATRMTLRFSESLRPVYVLGCELHLDDLEAAALSAQSKLVAMEVGRMLSSEVAAWGCIKVLDINSSAVSLQVSEECLTQLRGNVHSYFESLATCEIYTLQQSAWSQRRAPPRELP